ncbi:uncharacterized protein LOC128956983 [Oppia nitens]|uniref:uncharacterized protein LOC128956983 n=1 Tax=Oppia nitens TaxID=1686743 RepID=UPI0023DABD3E|nr:uncharacterized protein LOC128956983 [Oppia nitens]
MFQLNIFSTIVIALFVILSIDCIDSRRQLSNNDRQELTKFKLTVKLLDGVLNDNDNNNPDISPVGPPKRVWGHIERSGKDEGVYQHIDKNGKRYTTYGKPSYETKYYDPNHNEVSKEQWRQFNPDVPIVDFENDGDNPGAGVGDGQGGGGGGGGGASNSNLTEWDRKKQRLQQQEKEYRARAPIGRLPKPRWGFVTMTQVSGDLQLIVNKDGTSHSVSGPPPPPVVHYHDPNQKEITREQFIQFNTDWPDKW